MRLSIPDHDLVTVTIECPTCWGDGELGEAGEEWMCPVCFGWGELEILTEREAD